MVPKLIRKQIKRAGKKVKRKIDALFAEFGIEEADFDPDEELNTLEFKGYIEADDIEPIAVYTNAEHERKDGLVGLVKHNLKNIIDNKNVVIVERDAQTFREGVTYLLDKLLVDYGRLALKTEKPEVAFYLGETTNVHRFATESDSDIVEIQARAKVLGSVSQKLFYLQSRELNGFNTRTLLYRGELALDDSYGITILTRTQEKARELWQNLEKLGKNRNGRFVGFYDLQDYYKENGYFKKQSKVINPDTDLYYSYHGTLKLKLDEQDAKFEVHIEDIESNKNNNSFTSRASHYALQTRKPQELHATGGWVFCIVQSILGMDPENVEDLDDYQLKIINQTQNLRREKPNQPLICYALLPSSTAIKRLCWNGPEDIFDNIPYLENNQNGNSLKNG
jgi:hypothetical protein